MSASSPGSRHLEPTALPALELRAPAPLLTPLLRALTTAGLDPRTVPQPAGPVLLAHSGTVAPDAADDLVRASRPHVLVGVTASHVDLGPFIDPGLTACLHCLYAACAAPVLAAPGVAGSPPASLLGVAAAFLAHDVRRWADGHEPVTWSATVRIDTALAVERHPWLRHPQCGCTWSLPA